MAYVTQNQNGSWEVVGNDGLPAGVYATQAQAQSAATSLGGGTSAGGQQLSAADQAAITNLGNTMGQYDWSQLLGNVTLGTPAPGTPTAATDATAGIFATNMSQLNGQPTLAAQEAGGFFGPNMGYLSNDPTLGAEQIFGTAVGGPYNGQQTLQQEQLSGKLNNGQQTLQQEQLSGVLNNGQYSADQQNALGSFNGSPTLAATNAYNANANSTAALSGYLSKLSQNPSDYYAVTDTNGQLLGYVDRSTGLQTSQIPGNPATAASNWAPIVGPGGAVSGYTWQGNGPPPGGNSTYAEPFGVTPGNTTSITATNFKDANGFYQSMANQQASGAAQAPTVAEQGVGLQALQLLSDLAKGGPANAFSQQAVLNGLDSAGVSNAVDALSGKLGLPKFQAPQATPTPLNAQTLLQPATLNGTWAGAPTNTGMGPAPTSANPGTATTPGTPVAAPGGPTPAVAPTGTATGSGSSASGTDIANAYTAGLPAPNKIVGRAWTNLNNADGSLSDTQKLLLAAYQQQGYAPGDITNAVAAGLPQFKAPTFGSVASPAGA